MNKSTVDLEVFLSEIDRRPDDIEELFAALKHLPELEDCVRALARFARALAPGSKYYHDGDRYVLYPNFVAFTPRYKRAHHVTIELRGSPKEFAELDGLCIKGARADSYSKCDFRRPAHLAAVTAYIRRAHELYGRGAARKRSRPETREVVVVRP